MMDTNSDTSDPHLKSFIVDIYLHNVVNYQSLELINQNSHIDGRKKIEYILVSEDISHPSVGARHASFGHPFTSDYRGI